MGFFKRIFTRRNRDDDYFENEERLWDEDYFWQEERADQDEEHVNPDLNQNASQNDPVQDWDWDTIINERSYLKISDPYQRDKYIRSLAGQIKDASCELDKLSYEYNVVTAVLKDMDELEALPETEKRRIMDCAKKILNLEKERKDYESKKSKISESQYYRMEQYEDSSPKIYEDMRKAEKYREMIRDDLSRLDGEKQAYQYRRSELKHGIVNSRGMAMICILAMAMLFVMLFIMQFGFEMEVQLGYFLTIATGAIALTIIYARYLDQAKDLLRTEKGMNRIILLQNTVKIRYVNNVNLLDYLYLKYNVKSAREWKLMCDLYKEEKRARELNKENEEEMDYYQNELIKILRCYQLSDVRLWVKSPLALYDHREMVEIRHEHIVRRQKLRAQMDYNKRLAKDGEQEMRTFKAEYPEYADELNRMMAR